MGVQSWLINATYILQRTLLIAARMSSLFEALISNVLRYIAMPVTCHLVTTDIGLSLVHIWSVALVFLHLALPTTFHAACQVLSKACLKSLKLMKTFWFIGVNPREWKCHDPHIFWLGVVCVAGESWGWRNIIVDERKHVQKWWIFQKNRCKWVKKRASLSNLRG